jgi:prevent-host-death family protein
MMISVARVGMHEAKTQLSRLVERVEAGEEVVIQRHGKPVVRLVPIADEPRSLAAVRGIWRGRVRMTDDFDELPEDIAASFGADESSA